MECLWLWFLQPVWNGLVTRAIPPIHMALMSAGGPLLLQETGMAWIYYSQSNASLRTSESKVICKTQILRSQQNLLHLQKIVLCLLKLVRASSFSTNAGHPKSKRAPGHSSPTGKTSETIFKYKKQVKVQEISRVKDIISIFTDGKSKVLKGILFPNILLVRG